MKSSVVIGANWGDEGKGLMVDFLCKKYNADLVVRFNGGAQAGHTVVTPEGKRHVFSHIGSGGLLGVPTYLSEHFILNPIVFKKEFTELFESDSKCNRILVSPKSEVTTYWDMMANRAMEEMRGNDLHGSCGVGINATIDRMNFWELKITSRLVYGTLHIIKDYWKERLDKFSEQVNKEVPAWVLECFERAEEINNQFMDDFRFMAGKTILIDNTKELFSDTKYCVFEGAQGLELDQFYGNFPYVTRSNTGMRNVIDLQRRAENAFSIDEIVYVSRTYETRHGNDPYFIYDNNTVLENIVDKTNIKNEWQGEIKCRKLLYNRLANGVRLDLEANNLFQFNHKRPVRLALTHIDQIPVDDDGVKEFTNRTDHTIPLAYITSGETRNDVKELPDLVTALH